MNFLIGFVMPLAIMFGLMYFLIIKPQKKREKEHKELVNNLEVGSKIITNGGIVARIVTIKEEEFVINSEGSKLAIKKEAVNQIVKEEA